MLKFFDTLTEFNAFVDHAETVDKVILVGGSSATVFFKEWLCAKWKKEPQDFVFDESNRRLAVVQGMSTIALLSSTQSGEVSKLHNNLLGGYDFSHSF